MKHFISGELEIHGNTHMARDLEKVFKENLSTMAGIHYAMGSTRIDLDDTQVSWQEIVNAVKAAKEKLGVVITGYGEIFSHDGDEGGFSIDEDGKVTGYDKEQWTLYTASDENLLAELTRRGYALPSNATVPYTVTVSVRGNVLLTVHAAKDASANELKKLAGALFGDIDLGVLDATNWAFRDATDTDGNVIPLGND